MIVEEKYLIKDIIKKRVFCDKCKVELCDTGREMLCNPPKKLFICDECGEKYYIECQSLADEFRLEEAITDVKKVSVTTDDINKQIEQLTTAGEVSDGYHTFNELYHHRAILFAMICNQNKTLAWKSKLHNTGDMFDGMFIVGIETPYGQATYHYDIDPYWDMFNVKELEKAPVWDGHTPEEAINRILKWSKEI